MNQKTYFVYLHKSPSNKYYVGITSRQPEKRWGKNGIGYKTQIKFYRAIQKYGWESFEHSILYSGLSLEEAFSKEKELVIKYNSKKNGYNVSEGGDGNTGHAVSDEARQRISAANTGKPGHHYNPTRKKIYIFNSNGDCLGTFNGYLEAAEFVDAKRSTIINCCNYGLFFNLKYIFLKQEDLDLLSIRLEQLKRQQKLKAQPTIFQYNLAGDFIASYATYKEASSATGIALGSIGKCCSEIDLHVKGFIFLKSKELLVDRLAKIAARQAYLQTSYTTNKNYKVKQFDIITNELLGEYNSYKDAAESTGISYIKIKNNCNGKLKKIQNFKFIREELN